MNEWMQGLYLILLDRSVEQNLSPKIGLKANTVLESSPKSAKTA